MIARTTRGIRVTEVGALRLRLSAAEAVLHPGDRNPVDRFRADRAVLAEKLRRARVRAGNLDTANVLDEFEHTTLRLSAGAEEVFAAATAGRLDEARNALATLDEDSARLQELSEELATIAATRAEQRGNSLAMSGRMRGTVAVALAALVLAVEAGILAFNVPGPAGGQMLGAITPERFRHYLPWAGTRAGPTDTSAMTGRPAGSKATAAC